MSSPSTDRRLGLTGNKAYKAPCAVATTANITLSGEQTIGGVTTSESDVLVWQQTNTVDNGIWVSGTGTWQRRIDANTNQDLAKGTQVLVTGGTYAGQIFEFTSANPIIPGTSAITIAQGISSSTLEARLASTASASDGDALVGWGSITSISSGVLTRHATLSAAVTAVGSSQVAIVLRGAIPVSSDLTIAATSRIVVLDDAVVTIDSTKTLTINGRTDAPAKTWIAGAGKVLFGRGSVKSIRPQWWGARGDAAIDGSSGTDCTTALTAAIAATCEDGISDVSIHPLEIDPGNWLTGNLLFPPAFRMYSTGGRHQTNFVVKTGTTGKWFTDAGSASKITLRGFAMYGRNLAGITHLLQLGRNGVEFGTEGLIDDLFIRDSTAAGSYGFDVQGNVGQIGVITVQNCAKNIRIGGAANQVDKLVSMTPTEVGADLSYCDVSSLHIEAPGNSCVPLLLSRDSGIKGLTISLANNTTISHLFELDAACTNWFIRNVNHFFGSSPGTVTVTNGNFKRASGTYFGGNATAGSFSGNGAYSSETNGQTWQSFTLRIVNTAGTMQHRISNTSGVASTFASCITGASATLTNTPTGVDATTAMAAGGKIGATTPSIFWFDTVGSQVDGEQLFALSPVFTTTGTALTALPITQSININGVTKVRSGIQFLNDASGAAFSLTAGIAAGQIVQISVTGYFAK